MTLQIRRGTNAQRTTITPSAGELVYTTDTKKVYVGDGSTVGGVAIGDGNSAPAGPSGAIQYNEGGNFSGNNNLKWDIANSALNVTGNIVLGNTGGGEDQTYAISMPDNVLAPNIGGRSLLIAAGNTFTEEVIANGNVRAVPLILRTGNISVANTDVNDVSGYSVQNRTGNIALANASAVSTGGFLFIPGSVSGTNVGNLRLGSFSVALANVTIVEGNIFGAGILLGSSSGSLSSRSGNITGGSVTARTANIVPVANANITNIFNGTHSYSSGSVQLRNSNVTIANITTGFDRFGYGGQTGGIGFGSNVTNVQIGNITAISTIIGTEDVVIWGSNVSNINIGNVTTPTLRITTGNFQVTDATGGEEIPPELQEELGVSGPLFAANVNNVTIGNYTSGDIVIATGSLVGSQISPANVTGTYTRGNIILDANNVSIVSNNVSATGYIRGNIVIQNSNVPSSPTSSGVAGTVMTDADYVYVCVAPDTWRRAALTTW